MALASTAASRGLTAPSCPLRAGILGNSSEPARRVDVRCSRTEPATESRAFPHSDAPALSRRAALAAAVGAGLALPLAPAHRAVAAPAQSLPPQDDKAIRLCDEDCEKGIEELPLQTTPSGLQFRDIVVGKGPSPPVGFQVAADYVAMVPSGRVFDSSLEKKAPYIFRVGAGQVVAGLDEGILSMAVGGLRRLYIPGNLSFPKGLASAPGRPRVAPSSPVVFDVKLIYIPGLEDE